MSCGVNVIVLLGNEETSLAAAANIIHVFSCCSNPWLCQITHLHTLLAFRGARLILGCTRTPSPFKGLTVTHKSRNTECRSSGLEIYLWELMILSVMRGGQMRSAYCVSSSSPPPLCLLNLSSSFHCFLMEMSGLGWYYKKSYDFLFL